MRGGETRARRHDEVGWTGDVMNELRCPVAVRLLKLADGQQSDPVVAYLLAWSALEHVSCVVGEATGLRARFALHQNGVLRVRKEGGHKMPEDCPAAT